MRIGFDAKRAFQNSTGLGHYSRTLISSLAAFFPNEQYFLFAPKVTGRFIMQSANIQTISPERFPFTFLRSAWRSAGVKKELLQNSLHLYHGLSHEIPVGIEKTGIRTVVTMHDLIFERYPDQYKKADRWIYRRKFLHACKHADAIIAISNQTKQDLVDLYKVPAQKITVCYQGCDPIFAKQVPSTERETIRTLYGLPARYFLSVGSIIERKNLLTICKAMSRLKHQLDIPLVIIGNGSRYKSVVKEFIGSNGLEDRVFFLSDAETAKNDPDFSSSAHFPAIYQMAEALIYPSSFEGFGIPVLEALFSRVPVITSNVSCLPEAGGDAAEYIDPFDDKDLSEKMYLIATNKAYALQMTERGWQHAQYFTAERTAAAVMGVYKKLMP